VRSRVTIDGRSKASDKAHDDKRREA